MVYTVTFNPAIDHIVHTEEVKRGEVNRSQREEMYFGGKGINVSVVLRELGIDSKALGFTAGFTGAEIMRLLSNYGLNGQFIQVKDGISRINVKLRSMSVTESGTRKVAEESEINGRGPGIDEAELKAFYKQLDMLEQNDVLVLAGSIPTVLPSTIYRDIMAGLQDKGIMIVVDATRNLLVNVLEYHPFLIKPNNHELGEIFGVEVKEKEEVISYAGKLQEMGARNVLVSMAGDGAVLVAEDGTVYKAEAPKGIVKNSVGAGDSMVAGFLYGYLTEKTYEKAFYYGLCTGSASAFSEKLATRTEVEDLLKALK